MWLKEWQDENVKKIQNGKDCDEEWSGSAVGDGPQRPL
jgi:hypothetical protein